MFPIMRSIQSNKIYQLTMDTAGHPIVPRRGDFIVIDGNLWFVDNVVWNYPENKVVVNATLIETYPK